MSDEPVTFALKYKDPSEYYLELGRRLMEGPKPGARVHLGKFAILGIDIELRESITGSPTAWITMTPVSDADTGVVRPQSLTNIVDLPKNMGASSIRGVIRRELLSLLAHEVDEWLTVDGKRQPPEHDE